MGKIIVKCPYCEKQFDRNDPSISFIKVGRRYAHTACYEEHENNKTQEDRDYEALYKYIKELLGTDFNFKKIQRQLEEYKTMIDVEGNTYTYSGMLATLKWFYEISKGSKEEAKGGIGIIPFVYQDAKKYYYNLYLAQEKNKHIKNYNAAVEEITIPAPSYDQGRPHLWFEEEDE